MRARIEPSHNGFEVDSRDRYASSGRASGLDMEEEGRARARDDGLPVVVDHHGVFVRRTCLAEVLAGMLIEFASAGGALRVPVVTRRARIGDPPVLYADLAIG